MLEPRPHQTRALQLLRRSIAAGHRRPCLQMPTGAGKTYLAAMIIRGAREKNPNVRVTFVVDSVSLIDQTVKAFYEFGLHGISVIQADHPMQDWSKPIQIASVQTLRSRGRLPPTDILIVDECHDQHEWLTAIITAGKAPQ